MKLRASEYRAFGRTGLRMPPIMFGTCALADRDVIPDQTKRTIISEWFKEVEPPVLLGFVAGDAERQLTLQMMHDEFDRIGIAPGEVVINVRVTRDSIGQLERCRQLLGEYVPKLVTLDLTERGVGRDAARRELRPLTDVSGASDELAQLKRKKGVIGVGVAVNGSQVGRLGEVSPLDFVVLRGGYTLASHSPELMSNLRALGEGDTAVINGDPFHGGFLIGRDHTMPSESQSAWRKSFTALCFGHGIAPAHAAIQFALSSPATVAVAINSSHADRVAENASYAGTKVPTVFWDAMREEGLLENES
jgi:D-threo-aldose 1-dehydrogenase